MRLLKGLGYLLLTVAILAIIIFYPNWNSFQTLFKNQDGLAEGSQWVEKTYSLEGLTEYMALNPEHVSVVSYTVSEPDTGIYYRADQPRTMGSLANIFLAIEYARQVEQGSWDPHEKVSLKEINQFQLPNIDRTTHADAIAVLRDKGAITDGQLTLEQVVAAMVEYNDLAFSDYLYQRIGYKQLESLISDLGLTQTEVPLPYAGMYIAVNPHVLNRPFQLHKEELSQLTQDQFSKQVLSHTNQYIQDPKYRGKIIDLFTEENGLGLRFMHERDMYRFFPQTTAREMAWVMEQLMTKSLINESVSNRLWELLNWPLAQQQLTTDFDRYAAIYDNRMGILNGIDAGISTYTGAETVQAVFFDQLPVAFWLHMSSNFMHQDYQQRLIWDPALYMTSKRAFSETKDSLKAVINH